ncbi:MAG: type I glyceraldehyde-3-phosphate dehydrogenase [Paenibacillaceae bacterium]|nr:type I glyceraldehyde-3-phosphate dehydrogenase [Paenibacillaceae bacterium]
MVTTIGINGMGRIGRLLLRRAFDSARQELRIAAVNCLHPTATLAHLLKYDTVHGRWEADIRAEEGAVVIDGIRVPVIAEPDPAQLPWRQLGASLVIDATGKFTKRIDADKHRIAGAAKVIVSAPGKGLDLTVVMGVNDNKYAPARHHLLSAASCTTNCAAPVLHILDEAFGIERGWLTTVHAYTNDQNHVDNPHRDLRRARACAQSVIPTSTGAGQAIGEIIPHLGPLLSGISLRVPVANVSLLDLTVELRREVETAEAAEVLKQAARGRLTAIVDYSEEPLVSSDYNGCDKSAVIDGLSLMASGRQLKVLAWYDNEWAYACRVIDLARTVAAAGIAGQAAEPVRNPAAV